MKHINIDIANKDCRGISLIEEDNFPLDLISDIKQYKPIGKYKLQLRVTISTEYKKHQKKIIKEFNNNQTLLQAISFMNAQRDVIQNSLKDGSIQKERIAKKLSLNSGLMDGNSCLNDVFDDYIQGKKNTLKPKTILSYEGFYKTWLRDGIGELKVVNISRADLQAVIYKILSLRAPRTAKTIKEVLNPIFKNFVHSGFITSNPVELLEFKKFDNVKNPELSDGQIKALYEAINNYVSEPFRSIFVWLATGRRVNEVLSLQWNNLNLNTNTYTILPENNKAGKRMEYVLDDDLLYIVNNIPKKGEYIFPAIKNPKLKMHNDTLKKHWIKILEDANLVKIDKKTTKIIPMVRIHDLRHIVGLKLVNAGVSLEVIASVLGHTTTNITKRYSKVRTETAGKALSQFKELIK
ncbi:tyrosine-type recombinase/integrase [Sulfuricurvum sp.]|uniref:tyrosine-type recombinase/integrase n=1 Tax=Sulfuricurvum sp. TaxID=2025608 RepID=UPI0035676420